MTGPPEPHRLTSSELGSARTLVGRVLDGTPYLDRALEVLDQTQIPNSEFVAYFAGTADESALVLGGFVAGSEGVWQIRSMLIGEAADRDVGRSLMKYTVAQARDAGARLVVAELPADDVIGDSLSLLRASGFKQDGRIPDYFRDGVALLFLRLTL